MDKHSLLIVKESRDYCRNLGEFLSATGFFDVLPPAYDGSSAIESITKLRPEILLIDIILPNVDGIDVLRRIREQGIETKALAFSAFVDDNIAGMLQSLGIAYIIHTPATNNTVLGRILDFAVEDQGIRDAALAVRTQKDRAHRDEIVTGYMRSIGVPVNLSGYKQLKTAIAFVVEQGNRQIRVTHEVYKYVADLHDTTAKRVERNIRTAIEAAWERGDIKWQHKLFGYTVHQNKGRPTNKEFIAMLAERVRMRMQQT